METAADLAGSAGRAQPPADCAARHLQGLPVQASMAVAELVERYGGRRMVQALWVRWRCSRCGSADCLPCAIEGGSLVSDA